MGSLIRVRRYAPRSSLRLGTTLALALASGRALRGRRTLLFMFEGSNPCLELRNGLAAREASTSKHKVLIYWPFIAWVNFGTTISDQQSAWLPDQLVRRL